MTARTQTEYLTRAKYEAYKKQLEYMKEEGSNKLAILLASSPGSGMGRPLDLPIHDLAREFRAQLAEIDAKVHNAVIIEDYLKGKKEQDLTTIDIGATVTIQDMDYGDESTYMILGSDETAPTAGRISYLSPLGQALLGKRKGDIVRLNTSNARFKILRVEYRDLDYPLELVDWDRILSNTIV